MAHSIRVIGTNAGGTKDLLSDGRGLLYAPGDVEGLKAQMRKAIDTDEHEKRSTLMRSYEYAKENCSESAYVARVLDVYESLA